MDYDIVIRNGTIIDGTGVEGFAADVAISNGRIVEVGDVNGSAQREIDAQGQLVTPGLWTFTPISTVKFAGTRK